VSIIYPTNWGNLSPELSGRLAQVCQLVAEAGGEAWLVGGSVRDLALGRVVNDLDLEIGRASCRERV